MDLSRDFLAHDTPRLIEEIATPIDRTEVLRYLGYPVGVAANARLEMVLDKWIDEAFRCADPRAVYVVTRVGPNPECALQLLTARSTTEFRDVAKEPFAGARWVVAFIATAGPGLETLSRELMAQREMMAGMIVDAVGAERAEAAAKNLFQILRRHVEPSGLAVSIPVCPGQCGFELEHQTPLFALFEGQTAGVRLTPDLLMQPLKSVSGLLGIGAAGEIVADGTPCDRCDRPECAMRR